MKRSRQSEGESLLLSGEQHLRETLLEYLPGAAVSGSPIFTNSRFNPHQLPAHHLLEVAEAFLDMASACIEMRERLMLPADQSVGQLYIAACEEGASANEHRRGPRRLAADLLKQLQEGS